MTNTKIMSTGNLTAWWGTAAAFANPAKPTVAELAACLDITQAVSFDGFGFGVQASNKNSDPSWADSGNVQARGFANYGGAISFFYPQAFDVATDNSFLTWDSLDQRLTTGYIVIRIDGTKVNSAATAGDFVRVYKAQTDAWTDVNTGELNFKYTINFLPQGVMYIDAVVATSAPLPVLGLTGGGTTMTIAGGKKSTLAYRTGRQLSSIGTPNFFTYTSSDLTKATIDTNGVITPIATGSVTFTAVDKVTSATSTNLVITIS